MADPEIRTLLGWSAEEWAAARQWAMRNKIPLPDRTWPKTETYYGRLLIVDDMRPWLRIWYAWHHSMPDKPNLGRELMGMYG
jgi:hypothetical protein